LLTAAAAVAAAARVHGGGRVLHERGRRAGVPVQGDRERDVRLVLQPGRHAARGVGRLVRGADVLLHQPGARGLAVHVLTREKKGNISTPPFLVARARGSELLTRV
jgi:hypothetical protein